MSIFRRRLSVEISCFACGGTANTESRIETWQRRCRSATWRSDPSTLMRVDNLEKSIEALSRVAGELILRQAHFLEEFGISRVVAQISEQRIGVQ